MIRFVSRLQPVPARSMATVSEICKDQLKYDLLNITNITQSPIDKDVHTQRRLKMYKDTWPSSA